MYGWKTQQSNVVPIGYTGHLQNAKKLSRHGKGMQNEQTLYSLSLYGCTTFFQLCTDMSILSNAQRQKVKLRTTLLSPSRMSATDGTHYTSAPTTESSKVYCRDAVTNISRSCPSDAAAAADPDLCYEMTLAIASHSAMASQHSVRRCTVKKTQQA